jgi:hypothetical protein
MFRQQSVHVILTLVPRAVQLRGTRSGAPGLGSDPATVYDRTRRGGRERRRRKGRRGEVAEGTRDLTCGRDKHDKCGNACSASRRKEVGVETRSEKVS